MTDTSSRRLFRPVGLREMELILDTDARAFPPRLPEQPIFYPVTTLAYAEQIARDWNAKAPPGYVGFVTEFDVARPYIERFDDKVVGSKKHSELWVPAEELVTFNQHIVGRIRIRSAFYGEHYRGPEPLCAQMRDVPASDQLAVLARLLREDITTLTQVLGADWRAVLLNLAFWESCEHTAAGIDIHQKRETLDAIRSAWPQVLVPLPPP